MRTWQELGEYAVEFSEGDIRQALMDYADKHRIRKNGDPAFALLGDVRMIIGFTRHPDNVLEGFASLIAKYPAEVTSVQ